MHNRSGTSGNILFLILLAVVLFAALSYAVTESLRSGNKPASKEAVKLFAGQIIQNAGMIEQQIVRAQTINNIPDWGFDFSHPEWAYPNAACLKPECKIFDHSGGFIPPMTIPSNMAYPQTASANLRSSKFYSARVLNIGTEKNDVIIIYNRLSRDLCDALNDVMGNKGINLSLRESIGGSNIEYRGTMDANSIALSTGQIGEENTTLAGRKGACHSADSADGKTNRFFYVLMER